MSDEQHHAGASESDVIISLEDNDDAYHQVGQQHDDSVTTVNVSAADVEANPDKDMDDTTVRRCSRLTISLTPG